MISIPNILVATLPADALLKQYADSGAYTDCYVAALPCKASLADFLAAFYTSPVFKLERLLLAGLLRLPSTDGEARLLAHGEVTKFAAWNVESRQRHQILLAAGRTRSWLMVSTSLAIGEATTLFFGSAVVPLADGRRGWLFDILLPFHTLYSRILLGSAAHRLQHSSCH